MTLFVILSICSGIDARDCRVVESYRAPPGIIVCGAPSLVAHRIESEIGPRPDEFIRIRCRLQ